MVSYGMTSMDLFEANDLSESDGIGAGVFSGSGREGQDKGDAQWYGHWHQVFGRGEL